MKLKRMTNKKDHLVVEGKATVRNHITQKQVVIHFEGANGENANQYNRMTMSNKEALRMFLDLFKAIVKNYLQKPQKKTIIKRVA